MEHKDFIICAIFAHECPKHVEEFCRYHLSIGFDKVHLYDNNAVEDTETYALIQDLIDAGKVVIHNFCGVIKGQLKAYDDTIQHVDYRWCAFIDIDEFITLQDPGFDIRQFLIEHEETIKAYKVRWMLYGDNEIIEYDGRPMRERFTTPLSHDKDNNGSKSILHWSVNLPFGSTPHSIERYYGYYATDLKPVDSTPFVNRPCYNHFYIAHYYTKSLEEWVLYKLCRGFADRTNDKMTTYGLERFFWRNKMTDDKLRWLSRYIANLSNGKH